MNSYAENNGGVADYPHVRFNRLVYENVSHPKLSCDPFDALGKKLARALLSLGKPGTSIKILDLGCGTGQVTRRILSCLAKFAPHLQIDLYAVDFASDPNEFDDLAMQYKKGIAGLSNVQLVGNEVHNHDLNEGFSPQLHTTRYDVVIASFILHHLNDVRKSIADIIGSIHDQSLVLIAEITGDYAAWSRCFHKCTIRPGRDLEIRLKVLGFLNSLHRDFERYCGWTNSPETSASDVSMILDLFAKEGCSVARLVKQPYYQTLQLDAYMKELGKERPAYGKIPPSFSTRIPESTWKAHLDKAQEIIAASPRQENCYRVFVLRPGLRPRIQEERSSSHISAFASSVDLFEGMLRAKQQSASGNCAPALRHHIELEESLALDAQLLVDCGLVSGESGNISSLYYDERKQEQGRWNDGVKIVPFGRKRHQGQANICNGNVPQATSDPGAELLASQALYFAAASMSSSALDMSKQPPTITEVIYRSFPRKAIVHVHYDSTRTRPETVICMQRNGEILAFDFKLPCGGIHRNALSLIKNAKKEILLVDPAVKYNEIKTIEILKSIGLKHLDKKLFSQSNWLNLNHFNVILEAVKLVNSSAELLDDTWKPVKEAECNAFARALCLAESAGSELIHVPASVSLDEHLEKEVASGGVIITAPLGTKESLRVDCAGVQRCLQLRHRALFGDLYQRHARKALLKAARAAVYARNFSHVAGSHVVSNPEFRNVLLHGAFRLLREPLAKAIKDFKTAEKDAWAGGALNKYWGNARKALEYGVNEISSVESLSDESLGHFHEYLQGRFDFIARAIDDIHDHTEPILLVEEVFDGFLNQEAFLDTFVSDLGVRLNDMAFIVELPGSENGVARFKREWKRGNKPEDNKKWVNVSETKGRNASKSISDCSTLIGLPGGMIGVHAFYSLVENLMRNSIKYSHKDNRKASGEPEKYELTFSIMINDRGYVLTIYDNFTKEVVKDEQRLSTRLENYLGKDFVDEDGRPAKEGLGMLEMQASSKLLRAGGGDEPNLTVLPRTDEKDYKDGDPIRFRIQLTRPILLGVVGAIVNEENDRGGVSEVLCHKTIEDARNNPAHLVVINGDSEKWSNWKNWMLSQGEWNEDGTSQQCRNYIRLPARILLVASKPEIANQIQLNLGGLARRVVVVSDQMLHTELFHETIVDRDTVLRAYGAWIRAWKTPQQSAAGSESGLEHWDLWIGFQREPATVMAQWKLPTERFKSDLIHVHVVGATEDGKSEQIDSQLSTKSNHSLEFLTASYVSKHRQRALVFDNHGGCFPDAVGSEKTFDYREATRFYQKFGGSETPDLFRLLFRPPRNDFAFSFMIHALVESCLTRVAVLDERVAADLLLYKKVFFDELSAHQKAGVFPLFSFKSLETIPQNTIVRDDQLGCYTHRHRVALCKFVPWKTDGTSPNLLMEGFKFKATAGNCTGQLSFLVGKSGDEDVNCEILDSRANMYPACDVLIVHEGALDILVRHSGVVWSRDKVACFYDACPIVVRTSGRGRKTEHMDSAMPFVEFGEISSSLLTARNKYSLVRALLGAVDSTPARE